MLFRYYPEKFREFLIKWETDKGAVTNETFSNTLLNEAVIYEIDEKGIV